MPTNIILRFMFGSKAASRTSAFRRVTSKTRTPKIAVYKANSPLKTISNTKSTPIVSAIDNAISTPLKAERIVRKSRLSPSSVAIRKEKQQLRA